MVVHSTAKILSQMAVVRMTEGRVSGGNEAMAMSRIRLGYLHGFSAPRGDLFPVGGFGHTGYTGTGLRLDPNSQIFVVFLSNRVHPKIDPKNLRM